MKNGDYSRRARWRRASLWTVAALSALVVAAAGTGYARFVLRAAREYGVAPPALVIASDAPNLARGEHLARTLGGCAHCHGADFGGRLMSDDSMMRLVAPNITRGDGSAVSEYADRDWARAIMHGVGPSGRSLVVMPTKELARFADDDIAAVIAFMKALPPVNRDVGRTEVRTLGRIVFGLAGATVLSAEGYDHSLRRRAAPAADGSRAHGDYLVEVCRGCHGPDLRGGIVVHPGAPPSANISPEAMVTWDFAAFERALRTGVGKDDRALDESMPWRAMKELTPSEMRALWLALRQD